MFNSLDVLDDLVPVSELSNGRTGAVLSKADRAPVIIIKRNKPSYVLIVVDASTTIRTFSIVLRTRRTSASRKNASRTTMAGRPSPTPT